MIFIIQIIREDTEEEGILKLGKVGLVKWLRFG